MKKFKEIFNERKKIPAYNWINFAASKNDAKSVINKLKKKYPDHKFGMKNNKIHMNGITIFDLVDAPMDYFTITQRVNNLVNEEAVSNVADADIAKGPGCKPGKKKKILKKKNIIF